MSRVWLLPGLDGTGRLCAPLAHALCDHDVRIASYRGGDHDEILVALPRELSTPEPSDVIVAESFGGAIALRIAAQHQVRKLVLVASFVTQPRSVLPAALVGLFHPPPRLAIRMGMLGLDAEPSLVDEVHGAIAAVPASAVRDRVRALRGLDVRDALAHARTEILWIVARHDRLVPAEATRVAKAVRADLRVVVLDGPHLLAQRWPHAVAEAIARG